MFRIWVTPVVIKPSHNALQEAAGIPVPYCTFLRPERSELGTHASDNLTRILRPAKLPPVTLPLNIVLKLKFFFEGQNVLYLACPSRVQLLRDIKPWRT